MKHNCPVINCDVKFSGLAPDQDFTIAIMKHIIEDHKLVAE